MIYTFYSYKGGVGRSMALANIAELLYRQGKDVLIIDFDLEAPGLEDYFDEEDAVFKPKEIREKRGVIDLLVSYKELSLLPSTQFYEGLDPMETKAEGAFPYPVEPLTNFIVPIYEKKTDTGTLSIVPAGVRSDKNFGKYVEKVRAFDWDDFYVNWDGERFFDWFYKQATQNIDYVLIDSRTGVSEMGGVCTYQLADTVVLFISANQQNIDGTLKMASSLSNPELIEQRNKRPLSLVFVPSRIEQSMGELLNDFSKEFNQKFGNLFSPPWDFEVNPFLDLNIPYVPYYAFQEKIAVREPMDSATASPLRIAFDNLRKILIREDAEIKTAVTTEETTADEFFEEARRIWEEREDIRAKELVERAIKIWESFTKIYRKPSDLIKLARAKTFLSDIFKIESEIESITYAQEAVNIYFTFCDLYPNSVGEEIINDITELANRLHNKGEGESHLILFRVIEIQKNIVRDNDAKSLAALAQNLFDLSSWYIEQEQFGQAIKSIEEAIELYKELQSNHHGDFRTDLADSLITYSECLLEFNETFSARKNAVEAVEIYASLYNKSQRYVTKTAASYNALLDILSRNEINKENGSFDLVLDAEQFFRKLSDNKPQYKPDLAKVINMLTDPLVGEEQIAKAIEKQKEAIEIFREVSATYPSQYQTDLAGSLINLCKYLRLISDLPNAKRAATEAVSIYRKLSSGNSTAYKEELKESEDLINQLNV